MVGELPKGVFLGVCSIRILAKNIGNFYYEPLPWFMIINFFPAGLEQNVSTFWG